MSRFLYLLSPFLLIIISLTVILIFMGLGFYAYPSADDFCMVTGVNQEGLFPHLWSHYFEWSGRYSGNAFYAIYPYLFGLFEGYPFIPVVLIICLTASFAFFLSSLFRMKLNLSILLISLCFISIYLLGLRHTASSLYWMAGSLSYQTANILILLTFGLIIQLVDRQKQHKNYLPLFFLLIVIVITGMGTNETNMITLSALVTLVFITQPGSSWKIISPWLLLLLVALLCFSIVYFAPGNSVRESTFPLRHDWIRSINGSAKMGLWTLTVWTGNPVFIAATLLAPFAVLKLYNESDRVFTTSKPLILVLILITLAIPFVLQFPAWWAMGGWPPPRTVDAIFFVFLFSWLLLIGAITVHFIPQSIVYSEGKQLTPKASALMLAAVICFVLAVLINGKFQRAKNNLLELAKPFQQYMSDRHAHINDSLQNKQLYVTVSALRQEYPKSIYFNDIRPDPRDWRNVCYAEYFGLQGIRLEKLKKY